MAFQMPFTDGDDEFHEASYWRLDECAVYRESGAHLLFSGYANEEKKGHRVIGTKSYHIPWETAQRYLSVDSINPLNNNQWKAAYQIAKIYQDKFVNDESMEKVSFFENAKDV